MKKLAVACALLFLTSNFTSSQTWKNYPYTPQGSLITFPADEGWHPSEPVEWWYTCGHLVGDSTGNSYSYMLTYFYYPQNPFDGFRILNLANDNTGQFFDETLPVNYSLLSTDSLNIQASVFTSGNESWVVKTDSAGNAIPFEYLISAAAQNGSLDLDYITVKPPLILADSGFLYEGMGDYTYYYSQTMIDVSGDITFDNITETATGTAWIDRQYGQFNPNGGEQYEWFCLQLSNGMDLNIWNIFNNQNQIPDTSTYRILAAYVNDSTQFTISNLEIERLAYEFMPDSLVCYSQQWHITSDSMDIDLVVSALYPNHEVQLPFRFYEGATTIQGTINGNSVTGVGFAELLHPYEHPQLNITSPSGYVVWNGTQPIVWELLNPDDGRPVYYDVEVSYDNKANFSSIAQGLADTFFLWTPPDFSVDTPAWLKVTGYSIDTTLTGWDMTDTTCMVLDIIEIHPSSPVLVYPNPTTGFATISNVEQGITNVEVFDVFGRLVLTSTEPQVDMRGFPAGIYFVKIGEMVRKLVKE